MREKLALLQRGTGQSENLDKAPYRGGVHCAHQHLRVGRQEGQQRAWEMPGPGLC